MNKVKSDRVKKDEALVILEGEIDHYIKHLKVQKIIVWVYSQWSKCIKIVYFASAWTISDSVYDLIVS